MSMLSDPKRRQKVSADPRNKSWSNDESKFGEQLMKKMGWEKGKGLGRHEDGNTSHIKVSIKNNSLGLGCSQKHDDNWISHQDGFNDLLTSLNQDHSALDEQTTKTITPQSLQQKSKKAKRRVHYNKFTQGKDLSTYSNTDMNCIMGVRSNSSTPNNQSRDQSMNNSDDGGDSDDCSGRAGLGFASPTPDQSKESSDYSYGVQTIKKSTNIQEYFAQKMQELRERREALSNGSIVTNSNGVSNSNTTSNSDSEPVDKECTSTLTDSASVLCKESSSNVECNKTRKKKCKRKDRKHKEESSIEPIDTQDNNTSAESNQSTLQDEANMQQDMTDTKRKRKKKRKLQHDSQCDIEESAECSVDSVNNTNDTCNSTDGKNTDILKDSKKKSKKKKARKINEELA